VVSSSTPLVFLTGMSEKCQSTSPNAIQVKNQPKIIGIEEKLYVINQLKKVNKLLTFAIMLRLTHGIVHTSHDNADRFKERTKVSVSAVGMNHTKNSGCESLTFLLH
jgi:hypothetical protein